MVIEFGKTICPIMTGKGVLSDNRGYAICVENCALIIYKNVPKKTIKLEELHTKNAYELRAFCGLESAVD